MLDEARIVEAALKLAGEEGRLESVSMRALARELGIPVMTIYNYVPNREALYELVIDHVLRPVRLPRPDEGSWEDRIRQLERDALRAVGRYPGVSFDRRGSGAKEAARLAEGAMSILVSGGFDPLAASLAFSTLFTFMLGQVEIDAMYAASGLVLDGASRPSGLSRYEVFELGFEAVIAGLKATLPRPRAERSGQSRSPN